MTVDRKSCGIDRIRVSSPIGVKEGPHRCGGEYGTIKMQKENMQKLIAVNNEAVNMAARAQWKLPPRPTTTLVAKPFEGFNGKHESACNCNRKTESFLNKTLRQLGFLELKCPFKGADEHDVVIPRGLDSTNDEERIAALDKYVELKHKLDDVGLFKNADTVHYCIHEYLNHGLKGKIFFHPDTEEVPVGLLTDKQKDKHSSRLLDEARSKVKAYIPTLPKDSVITVLTNDEEIKDGVLGTVAVQSNGSFFAMNDIPKKVTARDYLEYLLTRGLFFSMYGSGIDYIAVVKTASDVKYVRLFDERIFEVDSEVGRKFAMDFLKYRGKSFADIFSRGKYASLPVSRKAFYVAFIDKNNVLKGGFKAQPKAAA